MKNKQLIIDYYEGDNESPSKVTKVKDYPDYGEHYYEVSYKNDDGEFTDIVFIQYDTVLVLPE